VNYLAHAYLSFEHKEILIGNLISDFVKGRNKFNYPDAIQKGIALHRAIDAFTDSHEAVKQAKNIFRPHYRLYSGVFTDVVWDHFLATDASEFTAYTLQIFSQRVYDVLDQHINYLPERFAHMLPYMKSQNWLFNYRTVPGTEASFEGLVRRARYIDESGTAAILFEKHYETFHNYYRAFFPDVRSFAFGVYEDMIKL
jgi:acyl carrier protein phosphodiesterase